MGIDKFVDFVISNSDKNSLQDYLIETIEAVHSELQSIKQIIINKDVDNNDFTVSMFSGHVATSANFKSRQLFFNIKDNEIQVVFRTVTDFSKDVLIDTISLNTKKKLESENTHLLINEQMPLLMDIYIEKFHELLSMDHD